MKRLLLLLAMILAVQGVSSQTWKRNIYGTGDNKGVKTIRIRPASDITIRTLEIDYDSLTYSTTLTGRFYGATNDSLTISLESYSDLTVFGTGERFSSVMPGRLYLQAVSTEPDKITVSLDDIDFLSYRNNNLGKAGEVGDGVIFASLFVLLISPFICIDYNDGTFNAERYKYWALGSTAALFVTVSAGALFNSGKKFQFNANWPLKKQKVWSFSKGD